MFELISKYTPSGDQPQAIKELVSGIQKGEKREQFPLSDYQKRGKSKREEEKKYLGLQYSSNIIN